MAERTVDLREAGQVIVADWADLDAADTGKPVALSGWPDKTVQIIGASTVAMEGSNDGGATWVALTNLGGTAITAAGLHVIRENTLLIRAGASGGANMRVVLVAAR